MRRLKYITMIAFAAMSCHNGSGTNNLNKIAADMAGIECSAISLREQRFALANKIRFAEDTLLHTKSKADTFRLHKKIVDLISEKEIVLQKSLALADIIKYKLDSLAEKDLKDTASKRKFNEALTVALNRRGCIEKP